MYSFFFGVNLGYLGKPQFLNIFLMVQPLREGRGKGRASKKKELLKLEKKFLNKMGPLSSKGGGGSP